MEKNYGNQHRLKNYPKMDFGGIPDWKIAYLAGLVDGEGSIIIPSRKQLRVGLFIANTHKGVLEWVLGNFPCGSLRLVTRKQRQPHLKICYQIYIQGTRNVYQLLKGLLPYLIIKKEHAELCIKFLEDKYGDALLS